MTGLWTPAACPAAVPISCLVIAIEVLLLLYGSFESSCTSPRGAALI
jgi:hypothetical protein